MSAKNTVKFFAVFGGITALSAEIFYDFSINTKSPIHMSKLNNLVQKATNTSGNEEEASAKYSGLTGTPEMKKMVCRTRRGYLYNLRFASPARKEI